MPQGKTTIQQLMMRMQSSIVGNNEIKFQVYGVETHFFDLQDSEKQNICIFFVSLLNVWSRDRSSRPECSVKKGVLRNFAKFTRKRLCQSLFFNKIAGWGLQLYLKRDSGTGCPYNCPKKNCPPPLRLGLGFVLGLALKLGFGAIVLEPSLA